MMRAKKIRRPSPLQRRVLIVLAALDAKHPGPVPTRNIERVLELSGDAPVYGPNLRASCRRMEAAGWLRTLRAPNLQLAVELTSAGREVATPLLVSEQERQQAEQRSAAVMILPLVRKAPSVDMNTREGDLLVQLDNVWYTSCRGLRHPSRRYHLPAVVELGRTPDPTVRRSPAGGHLATGLSRRRDRHPDAN